MGEKLEASFSVLIMSIASSAVMAMGLAPNPQTGETSKDKNMARFNIDLLLVLQEKTKGNLTGDETKFLENLISDLQMKYVSI
ncbi:DUF1844 domain-containing protein [Bdellovibrio bacteriovorus]|uniref:DUF1844 domain-containing protein n=1 Tax=Bdellovibrio bacteriovorus TaxID=959 RepID=A0A150WFJ9_BDEBC|nr:DUF1844 domain-containing protein [Bdellovibrio bacteriovorus]KYG61819.1 hypothetical protein AZI85_06255 [Bdellovibrio bacteriovorus]KYG67972.1 hypothetical protein AZI87_01480 [Bdellovibrio bacteriovorus]